MKDRTLLLERLMTAQTALRRRFLDVASPNLHSEFAEVGGTTVHQMEVVRRLLLGDGMSMREVAEAQGIGLSGAIGPDIGRVSNLDGVSPRKPRPVHHMPT